MDHGEAVAMLSPFGNGFLERRKWVDLGCGSGIFTAALAQLLPQGSAIHAVDSERKVLQRVPDHFNEVAIEKHTMDFVSDEFPFSPVDGVLMANSLHFVKNKSTFLEKVKAHLNANGCIMVVEYDMSKSNPWVPHPLSFEDSKSLFIQSGLTDFRKLSERPSRYNRAQMFSAVAFVQC